MRERSGRQDVPERKRPQGLARLASAANATNESGGEAEIAAGSPPVVRDRPLALGLALPIVPALSGGDGLGQAGNGDPMAPPRVSALLALAFKVRTTIGRSRGS